MPARRVSQIAWIVVLTLIAAVAGGTWYTLGDAGAGAWLRTQFAMRNKPSTPGGAMPEMADMPMPKGEKGSDDDSATVPPKLAGYTNIALYPEVQQRIGVAIGRVAREPLTMKIRAVGIVRPDETKTAHIHVRTEGWVTKLMVNFTGQEIRTGTPMLSIYSPEFYRTQLDYVTAKRSERLGGLAAEEGSLAELSLRKLKLLDVSAPELQTLTRTGTPQELLTLRCPVTGTVLEKNVLEQEYVTPQRDLYVVADLSSVWVQAKVYEYELPHVELGTPAEVSIPAVPGRRFSGKVVFIQPTVEETTRTVPVRVELPNPQGLLKPGLFADIDITHPMGDGLLVPTSAVIRTGTRDIAFLVIGDDQFQPVQVQLGEVKFGDRFQILAGLNAGDRVVTSANFLIDSESRLREGGGGAMPGMDMGGKRGGTMPGMDMSGKGAGAMPGMPGRDMGTKGGDSMPGMNMGGKGDGSGGAGTEAKKGTNSPRMKH
jgi:Cu(I)/Ag(I) efflux system membrane fusion protein